jgi:hypothetical protein
MTTQPCALVLTFTTLVSHAHPLVCTPIIHQPVNPKAQSKVPLPDDVDLDAPLNPAAWNELMQPGYDPVVTPSTDINRLSFAQYVTAAATVASPMSAAAGNGRKGFGGATTAVGYSEEHDSTGRHSETASDIDYDNRGSSMGSPLHSRTLTEQSSPGLLSSDSLARQRQSDPFYLGSRLTSTESTAAVGSSSTSHDIATTGSRPNRDELEDDHDYAGTVRRHHKKASKRSSKTKKKVRRDAALFA